MNTFRSPGYVSHLLAAHFTLYLPHVLKKYGYVALWTSKIIYNAFHSRKDCKSRM